MSSYWELSEVAHTELLEEFLSNSSETSKELLEEAQREALESATWEHPWEL